MYIEKVPNRNSPPAILLRESYREDGKVKKRTLANLSRLPEDVVNNMKLALKGAKLSIDETITLASQIEKVRTKFEIKNVVWVRDRGILTNAKINELVKPVEGLDYISGLTKAQIKKLAQVKAIQ